MDDKGEYFLRISAFTPDTIPLARLAEYMTELATLLGHEKGVHFVRLDVGSTVIVNRVDDEEQPQVRDRLALIRRGQGPADGKKAFTDIDRMLAQDNAVGSLCAGRNAEIIRFPGRDRPKPVDYGPITQRGSLDGIPIRIGGKDETVSILLEDGDRLHKCRTDHEQARKLAHHLFDRVVRVHGSGQWRRMADGVWHLERFTIASFEILDDSPLSDVIARLRSVPDCGWKDTDDPLAGLHRLRHGDDGGH